MRLSGQKIIESMLIFSLYMHSVQAQSFVITLSDDSFNSSFDDNGIDEYSDLDEFGESELNPEQELDPGSWRPIFEPNNSIVDSTLTQYYSGLQKIISAASEGNTRLMEEAVNELDACGSAGDPQAQSMMGFIYGMGITRETDGSKSFLQHQLAADGGNMQSKMALAFRYIRQDVSKLK